MRASLEDWITTADVLRQLEQFEAVAIPLDVATMAQRTDEYYMALVGELFDRMRGRATDGDEWARLGNALSQFGDEGAGGFGNRDVNVVESRIFAAACFYLGGFPASAYVAMGDEAPDADRPEAEKACFELLRRPSKVESGIMTRLLAALRAGDLAFMDTALKDVRDRADDALFDGPDTWIPSRLLDELCSRFATTNLRAVLPDGQSAFWTPFVRSMLNRSRPTWEYFPSQVEAIQRGLLEVEDTYSLQMPTGAGKTTLCETLLYSHASKSPSAAAVLLVPYRSLASELKKSLVSRLNRMHISARCQYGGTVPTGDEVRGLDEVQVLVATPESLTGLLGANPDFAERVSLVICDEGHLLDAGSGRGVGLELLMARMQARPNGAPRFVFVSAIVPNIEEINAWLGGTDGTVVRSDYRPALAEFAKLETGAQHGVDLVMHPQEPDPIKYVVHGFLRPEDFKYLNPASGRMNTYASGSVKTRAIAAARKSLPMGGTVVFAANKHGGQGATALAEELLKQLECDFDLPRPMTYVDPEFVGPVTQYMSSEYGSEWVGTRSVASGAVLHHGDIPQETREVLESLLRNRHVRMAICTSTLAEGVNYPIRTLVLYSVRRMQPDGRPEDLLTRDIKNLVGRAGRAGATTRGLVICANPAQWGLVQKVAKQSAGEAVSGALLAVLRELRWRLAFAPTPLTNASLESDAELLAVIDGIDATLVDLCAEEIGDVELQQLARELADKTFAATQANEVERRLLEDVFALRASAISGIRLAGQLNWIRETGTRARMLGAVQDDLSGRLADWSAVDDALDPELVNALVGWAWDQSDVQRAVREAFKLDDGADTELMRPTVNRLVSSWLGGDRYAEMAVKSGLDMDKTLGILSKVLGYQLQAQVDQGVALLDKLLASDGTSMSTAVREFPDHLRFGVPTRGARILSSSGVWHRHAAVLLGAMPEVASLIGEDPALFKAVAYDALTGDPAHWRREMGDLVFDRTSRDLRSTDHD